MRRGNRRPASVWILAALLTFAAGHSAAQEGPARGPLSPGELAVPDTFWIDPRFGDTTWLAGAPEGTREHVTVWFDVQLLPDPDGYARAVEELADAPRRALRAEVVDTLRAIAARSWRAARSSLRELERVGAVEDCTPHWLVNGFSCALLDDPSRLAAVPGVRVVLRAFPLGPDGRAEESGPRHVAGAGEATESWSHSPVPWHLEALRVPEVWAETGLSGRGVLNVVHDFGFRLDAPHVAPTLWVNRAEVPGNGVDDDGNGRIDDVHGFDFDQRDARINVPNPSVGGHIHGNTVAGIIAGRATVDTGVQLGVAPGSRWSPVVGLGRFVEALEWALEVGADTYTMSYSLPGLRHLRSHWRKAFENAALAGLFPISGAGNFADPERGNYVAAPEQMRVPEDIPLAVLGVSGLGPDGARPAYSSRGPVVWETFHHDDGFRPKPDLATVNARIVAADTVGIETGPVNGNSFAGPHLAGVLALMLEADPDLTPWRARTILIETARDVGPAGYDFGTGHGQVDALAAVRRVLAERERGGGATSGGDAGGPAPSPASAPTSSGTDRR